MKYYLTTPIYYVNAAPHLGTAYSTFVADLIKRFKKMAGYDPVVFTTGSDEHSRKVERAAKAAGTTPRNIPPEWRPNSRTSGAGLVSATITLSVRPIPSITKLFDGYSSAARATVTSTKAPTAANIALMTSCTSTTQSPEIHVRSATVPRNSHRRKLFLQAVGISTAAAAAI